MINLEVWPAANQAATSKFYHLLSIKVGVLVECQTTRTSQKAPGPSIEFPPLLTITDDNKHVKHRSASRDSAQRLSQAQGTTLNQLYPKPTPFNLFAEWPSTFRCQPPTCHDTLESGEALSSSTNTVAEGLGTSTDIGH